MAQKQLNLITALKDGQIVNIDDVDSGLKCGCVCPACGETLVAKKGSRMMHHFAHHAGHNCEYSYESSQHLAAKAILSKAKRMTLPSVYVIFPDSHKKDELVCEATEIEIERVELEKRFGDIVPDIVVYAGGKQFFVEIYVTHRVDEEKLAMLRKADISTIEIDLSKKKSVTSPEELAEILLRDSPEKTWKYNSVANKYLQRFYQYADTKKYTIRRATMQIDNCPINSRMWKGRSYANYIDDCLNCKYCVLHSYKKGFLCSGRRRIATIQDFKTPEAQRIRDSNNDLAEKRESAFAAGICPFCGDKLVERNGAYGTFWGCRAYPHCRFTASADTKTGELKMKG